MKWNPDGTIVDLGVPSGGSSAYTHGINDAGDVVGSTYVAGSRGVRWSSDGTASLLPRLNGADSEAWAINNNGVVVGRSGSPFVAIKWQ